MTDNGEKKSERRDVLRAVGGLSLGAALAETLGPDPPGRALPVEPVSGRSGTTGRDRDADTVFPQGVAAGDPTTEGVVLWTRIDPGAYDPTAPLTLEVTAASGYYQLGPLWAIDTDTLPERDYTVKVDLDGHLDPGREYYYRFVYDDVAGPVGRCRTLPAAGSSPESVRFGVLTCQDYRKGYYGALRHVAEDDLDYLLHLGDFIYEWAGGDEYADRTISLPSGHNIAWGLEDFRHLYRTYRGDQSLQEALARYSLIATWDDHEIVNNRYWDYDADQPAVDDSDHPRSDDPEFLRELFADGIQAWWEYMPVRVGYEPDAESLQDRLRLWRSFRFGDLLDLVVTDERLYRSEPDQDPRIDLPDEALTAPGRVDLDHTMLGAAQRGWFTDVIADDTTTWTGWANEVLNMHLVAEYRGEQQFDNSDAWDGYETERRLIMRYLAEQDVENFVALTGDLHTALGGHLHVEYDGTDAVDDRVGVEVMTPSVTSTNLAEAADLTRQFEQNAARNIILEKNPHMEFFDSFNHGYAVVEFTPDACEYTAYAVDITADPAEASRKELGSYRVPAGEPRLEEL